MTAPTDSWTLAYNEFVHSVYCHRARLSYQFCWIKHPLVGRVMIDFGFLLGENV